MPTILYSLYLESHGKSKYVVSTTMKRLLKIEMSWILTKSLSPDSKTHWGVHICYQIQHAITAKNRKCSNSHEIILIRFVFLWGIWIRHQNWHASIAKSGRTSPVSSSSNSESCKDSKFTIISDMRVFKRNLLKIVSTPCMSPREVSLES